MEGRRKKNGRSDGQWDKMMDPSTMKTDEGMDMGGGEAGEDVGK